MTHEVIRLLLDDYVSGDLSEDARGPVSDHIAGCAICRSEVADLESITSRAAGLPKSVEPPADAWQGIRAAIEREKVAVASHHHPASRRRPYAIAAAVLLAAALSSIGTALYLNGRNSNDQSRVAAESSTVGGNTSSLAAFTIEENTYLRNVAVLQDMLDRQEGSLAPETLAQLKASLRTIDEAILEARNALARDPANKTLIEMLSGNYRQKVDLLRRTTEMTRGS
jgi:hypothetical protein